MLEHSVRKYGEREALRQFSKPSGVWVSHTYRELWDLIQSWRRAFATLELSHGTRVAILMPNGVDHVCADQAALANSLVPVPLHAIDTPGACAFIMSDSRAQILITNKLSRWEQIR